MLDNVKVESYGSMATLASVAQASMKGPQLIVLTVYDPGVRAFCFPSGFIRKCFLKSFIDISDVERFSYVRRRG